MIDRRKMRPGFRPTSENMQDKDQLAPLCETTPLTQSQVLAEPLLCVDLDGTLITSDLLWEGILLLLREDPVAALRLPYWALGGRAKLKTHLANRIAHEAQSLPYNAVVLNYLKSEHKRGRKIVLVTASEQRWAQSVADHLGIFHKVLAIGDSANLKGAKKVDAIRDAFGSIEFDYVGDSRADLPIWSQSRKALVVRPSVGLLQRLGRSGRPMQVLDERPRSSRALIRLLRPHQWAKNLLLLVPVITAHRASEPAALFNFTRAFLAFCCTASTVYIFNDMLDIAADRRHRSKYRRPLASGTVSIPRAILMALTLALTASLLALSLSPAFGFLLLTYVGLTTAYTMYLKEKLMVDVLCLAGLYTLRISAGGAASSIVISPWLQAFSIFFFLSLAFLKRYTELLGKTHDSSFVKLAGRGYMPVDISSIQVFGTSSGYLCVLVFCLYISSPDVMKLYHHPTVLWLICPILLYWITRVWFLGQRQQMPDDPVLFALRDRISYLAAVVVVVLLAVASYPHSLSFVPN
jgi:4-hydroxybenzoate polyprenyltransferase/phosphoserine phosphatase